jgi:hypothetical protein
VHGRSGLTYIRNEIAKIHISSDRYNSPPVLLQWRESLDGFQNCLLIVGWNGDRTPLVQRYAAQGKIFRQVPLPKPEALDWPLYVVLELAFFASNTFRELSSQKGSNPLFFSIPHYVIADFRRKIA